MNNGTSLRFDPRVRTFRYLLGFFAVVALASCGGGGGSSSSSGSGSSSSSSSSASPSISLSIVDSMGATVTSNSVSRGAAYFASARLLDSAGGAVPNKIVSFQTNSAVATLSQSSGLTNSSGVAQVQISPAGLTSAVATLSASATVGSSSVSGSLDYQTTAGSVVLSNMTVGSPTLGALQTTAVTVQASVGGSPATSGLVSIGFSATCGSFSPTTASTDGSGLVSTVYRPDTSCSGSVTLYATPTTGGTSLSRAVTVSAATATNVVFDSATPSLMVTAQAPSGIKQSTVKFKVLNAAAEGMSGQTLTITLSSAAINAGVKFLDGTTTNQTVVTQGDGSASVIVQAGALPTPVGVTATHAASGLVASSSGVAVSSGVPTQNSASFKALAPSIEGFDIDGISTTVTWRVSDRQGNPIAPGAVVNVVNRSNSLAVGSCTLNSSSACSVTFTSQGLRPSNGRVALLAYMDGEESFIDRNGNNQWDAGEPFYDVGTLYLDENESTSYDAATEQIYPGGMVGASACASAEYSYPSIANTCDGTWSSGIRVRQQAIVVLAGSKPYFAVTVPRDAGGFTVRIQDARGNSMPTGSTVTARVTTLSTTCAVTTVSPGAVEPGVGATIHTIKLNRDPSCPAVWVEVTVTTPRGTANSESF